MAFDCGLYSLFKWVACFFLHSTVSFHVWFLPVCILFIVSQRLKISVLFHRNTLSLFDNFSLDLFLTCVTFLLYYAIALIFRNWSLKTISAYPILSECLLGILARRGLSWFLFENFVCPCFFFWLSVSLSSLHTWSLLILSNEGLLLYPNVCSAS